MDADAICQFLEWDSQLFGCRIGRANITSLTPEAISNLEAWRATHRIDCLYFLSDSADQPTTNLALANEFRLVDIRITLERQIQNSAVATSPATQIRKAVEADIPALREIARYNHRDSRFYNDGHFSAESCDKLYEVWIEKSCRGWAQSVFVAAREGLIQGYLTCHLKQAGCGQIGLVGVAENARAKGIGTALISAAVEWFAAQGAVAVSVITQGRNVQAQRLYQKNGFTTRSVELWFHRWFANTKASS